MRFLAVLAPAVGVLVVLYLLARGPQADSPPQVVARAAADSITHARLEAFSEGRFEDWAGALRRGGLIIGPDSDDVLADSADAVTEMAKDFGPMITGGRRLEIEPRLVTGATRRGRLAWVGGELDASATSRGGGSLRQTAAYLLRERRWVLLVETLSRGLSWDEVRERARAGRFPRPAELVGPEDGDDESSLARRFRRWAGNPTRVRLDHGVILVGPVEGEVAVGDSAAKVMLRSWKEQLGPLRLAESGVRVWVSDGGGAGWVAANVEASPKEWGGTKLPLRVTSVWRSTGEDSWRLVVAHVSAAVPDGPGSLAEKR